MVEWVTRRAYPNAVIMETIQDLLYQVDPEFAKQHADLSMEIATEIFLRLELTKRD